MNMKRIPPIIKAGGLLLAVLSGSACLGVQVLRDVHDPDHYFRRAYMEIERIQDAHEHRPGSPSVLRLLIHDRGEDELVRIRMPLWMFKAAVDIGLDEAEKDEDFGKWKNRYRFDTRVLRHLDRVGPGLLVDLTGDGDRILIWLE